MGGVFWRSSANLVISHGGTFAVVRVGSDVSSTRAGPLAHCRQARRTIASVAKLALQEYLRNRGYLPDNESKKGKG
jgi:hypothetical protein